MVQMLLYVLGGAVLAWVGLRLLHPLAVVWHEFGHALPALFLSRGEVQVDAGRSDGPARGFGRLRLRISPTASSGSTSFHPDGLGRWALSAIALGGPVASAGGAGIGVLGGLDGASPLGLRFLAFVFAWAHLRVLAFTFVPSRTRGRARAPGARGAASSAGPPSPERSPGSPPGRPPGRGADWQDLRSIWSGRPAATPGAAPPPPDGTGVPAEGASESGSARVPVAECEGGNIRCPKASKKIRSTKLMG